MFENEEYVLGKSVNIFELLPPINLYNKNESINNYLNNSYFDTFNFYPNIYKTIGNYLYNNYFFNKRDNSVNNIDMSTLYKMSEDVFEYIINTKQYNRSDYPLLKDLILIVILDEFERNNYEIKE